MTGAHHPAPGGDPNGGGAAPDDEGGGAPDDGPVVLDIGDDVGALVARLGRGRAGTELHVRRDGDAGTVHTGVRERTAGADPVTVAVFPELVEGTYDVLDERGTARWRATIVGGRLTEIDLR